MLHAPGDGGAPLLLLHGITDSAHCWPDAVSRWQDEFDVHAMSLRGHGASDRFRPEQLPHMFDLWCDDVVQALAGTADDEGIGRAVLVGHSLGGRVALAGALAHPELVAGLVLEDPAIHDWPSDAQEFRRRMTAWMLSFDEASEVAALRASGCPAAELAPWALAKRQVDRGMLRHAELGQLDGRAALGTVTVPTLVVAPQDTTLVPPGEQVSNPLVRIELLDGVGHTVRRDDPERYHALVDPFLPGLAHEQGLS